ncbi:hypothetical protein Tco_0021033, partial [Tanacetum coccineum]
MWKNLLRNKEKEKLQWLKKMSPPPKKTQKQLDDERAGLEEAMRLQAEQQAEHAEQIHLDPKYYTEEDWDIIRANVESNAELSKILLGENEPEEDFATRMVNLLNQRKKFFAEKRAQLRRNKLMTQTQQRTYMST